MTQTYTAKQLEKLGIALAAECDGEHNIAYRNICKLDRAQRDQALMVIKQLALYVDLANRYHRDPQDGATDTVYELTAGDAA